MALEDMTIAELRDLGNKTHVTLGASLNKADIIEVLRNAGVDVDEPEAEPQAEVEAEEEPEGYEYDQPKDEQPLPGTPDEEPLIQAGGYVATEKGWVTKESLEG